MATPNPKLSKQAQVLDYWTSDTKITPSKRLLVGAYVFLKKSNLLRLVYRILKPLLPSLDIKGLGKMLMTHTGGGPDEVSQAVYKQKIPLLYRLANAKLGGKAMDWGSGNGAFARAWGRSFDSIFGVDVSNTVAAEAAKSATKHKVNFTPLVYDPTKPVAPQIKVAKGSIDLFICHAVYMHFPSTEFGRQVTAIASKCLKKGGLAFININTPDSNRYKDFKRDQAQGKIPKGEVLMTRSALWTLAEFKKMVKGCGFEVLKTEKTSLKGGAYKKGEDFYYYFYLRKA